VLTGQGVDEVVSKIRAKVVELKDKIEESTIQQIYASDEAIQKLYSPRRGDDKK
jgi:hypothetical protein